MSSKDVDELPVADFYNYIACLEQMIDDQKRAADRMASRR